MRNALSVLVLSIVFSVPAFADMNGMGQKRHGEGDCKCHEQKMEMSHLEMMGHMMKTCLEHADMLGLTDEQVAKIKAIHRNMERNKVRLSADAKLAEMDLKDTLEVKDFDLDKATAEVQKLSGIKTNEHLEMLKSMKEVRSILTDDQFKKMKKIKPMMECEKKPTPMMNKEHMGQKNHQQHK